MQRRALIAAVSTLALPLSGCSSDSSGEGVRDTDFRRTGDCRAADEAAVAVDGSDVTVDGCVVGPNGCAEARLAAATLTGSALRVVVEAVVPDDAEACTQALVGRSYRASVDLADAPESVRVVHRGVDDETVATWP